MMSPALPPPLSPPGRIGLIGAGAFGRFCLQAYETAPDVQVVAVADIRESALQGVASAGLRMERDWRDIVHDDAIEAIHIVTPPRGRAEIVEVAAAAGKSVFCEKPLALTLEEADRMIDATQRNDVALGVDYVMRFQPAYRFLEGLAASALAGNVRSISFQNFAQHLPAGHWFWNREQSGGILVEHGVHFFDSYGRIAGLPVKCAALQPSRESIEVAVWYKAAPEIPDGAARTAVGRYYHEFAFPGEMEYAQGVVMFDRGRLEIRGWIPTSLSGAVEGDARQLRQVGSEAGVDLTVAPDGRVARFDASFPHRQEQYASAVLAGMRDVILRHRDPAHQMTVSVEDARRSLDVALAAQRSADAEAPEAFWRYTD